MKQQVDKNGVLILLVSLLFITGLPAWVAYICGGDFLIKNLYGLLGYVLLLFLPLYFSNTWGDCASFDKTLFPEKKRHYLIIAPLTFLLLIISISVGYIIVKMGIQKPYIYTSNTNLLFFNWFMIIIIAPIAEEIFWRGYVLGQFTKLVNVRNAILLHSVFFSVSHIPSWGVFSVKMFLSGLVLGYWRIRYRALVPLIIAHVIVNALAMLPTMELL